MAEQDGLTPMATIGAVVFGTADGFDYRGLGALSQVDKAFVTLLDMRGGIIRLSPFEDVGLPLYFAVPLRNGSTNMTLLGLVRPCRDATNRPGLVGAGVALALREGEDPIPGLRGRQAFALAEIVLKRLVKGSGFEARADFSSFQWPKALAEAARFTPQAPTGQVVRGAFLRQTIAAEWLQIATDPVALFNDFLRTEAKSALGPGLIIEPVNTEERRQAQHFSLSDLASRSESATQALQDRLQNALGKVAALERAGQTLQTSFNDLRRERDRMSDEIKTRSAELDRMREDKEALVTKFVKARDHANWANARIDKARQRVEAYRGREIDRLKTAETKLRNQYELLKELTSDKARELELVARLARLVDSFVEEKKISLVLVGGREISFSDFLKEKFSSKDAKQIAKMSSPVRLGAALKRLSRGDRLWETVDKVDLDPDGALKLFDEIAPRFDDDLGSAESPPRDDASGPPKANTAQPETFPLVRSRAADSPPHDTPQDAPSLGSREAEQEVKRPEWTPPRPAPALGWHPSHRLPGEAPPATPRSIPPHGPAAMTRAPAAQKLPTRAVRANGSSASRRPLEGGNYQEPNPAALLMLLLVVVLVALAMVTAIAG
jgi:hypothetical protein